MAVDSLELVSETTGRALRANTVNAARLRVDKDNGDIVFRDANGTKRRLTQNKTVEAVVPGTSAATAANYGVFFTAPFACKVTAIVERHATAGSDAGAVTVMLKKVASGTAASAGTDMLSAGISLKGTADTNAAGSLSATAANLLLAAGDSLALVTTGTLTAVAGVCVTVTLEKQ